MGKAPSFASRVADLEGSPIREVLARASSPGMVSFAGGLPAPETFPTFKGLTLPSSVLQYGPTEGDGPLRAKVAQYLQAQGLSCNPDQVLILSGSQQGIDFAAKLFLERGRSVAVPAPTYLAALQVFRFFGAAFQVFDEKRPVFIRSKPSLLYCNPTFQNPTGRCWTYEERRRVAKACDSAGIPIFEDDPYRELGFGPCNRTPVCSLLKKSPWIYQGSFSKTLCPGLRIGFLASSRDLALYLNRLKQSADLHTNRVSQYLVLQRWAHGKGRAGELSRYYKGKRDSFSLLLKRYFRALAEWEEPQGGLFYWIRLRSKVDTRSYFKEALDRGVAFMPGEHFFPHGNPPKGFMRLNFSHASEQDARKGLEVLAELLGDGLGSATV